jgi:predicted Zn-dependent peptidase
MNYLYQAEDAMTPAELARLERLERIVAANGISTAGTGTIDKQGEDALAYADERGWSAFLGVNLARTEAQTVESVNAAARSVIRPSAMTWVVVGDLSKIEKDIRALGIGEVRVLDADGKVLR